ncbi:hypothetical protein Bca52824_083393 [Brassica carinata]|uniref:Uncharacterized protein n=1 Tax=Brassica carinata TaxID=52824 RepID=A0A8X7PM80_BRACI|nr:hypothetical protein Bca52824_083393 [Brassica carinata]
MDSDAGSSVARRRRRLLTASHLTVSIFLLFIFLLHEFLVGLGFFSSFVVASFNRSCRCRTYLYPLALGRSILSGSGGSVALAPVLLLLLPDDCSPLKSLLENNDQGLSFVHMFLESMLVPLESEVKSTSLFVRVKESSVLMSELSQEKSSQLCFGVSVALYSVAISLVLTRFPTRLTVLVQCFTEHLLKSSQDSRSFSTNSFWPTLPQCMHRPQLATSTSIQCSNHSTNISLCKRSSYIPIEISENLFNSFTVLLSCLVICMGPEDATRLVLVMCSGGKGLFSMSQHIQHMVTMVYESGFTVNLLSPHLSVVSFLLSISLENLPALTSYGFKFQR